MTTTSAGVPPSIGDRAALWLQEHYPKRSNVLGLLTMAQIDADANQSWQKIVGALGAKALKTLLLSARDDHEDSTLQALLEQVSVGAWAEQDSQDLGDELDRAIEAARVLVREERYSEAAPELRRLLSVLQDRPVQDDRWRVRSARVLMNLAITCLESGDAAEARGLLGQVDLPQDERDRRVTLGRLRVRADDLAGALDPVRGIEESSGAEAVRQLVQLRRGELPPDIVDDPEVQLAAAAQLINHKRAAWAAELAETVLTSGDLTEYGRGLGVEVIYLALAQTVMELTLEPVRVSDRGRLLGLANRIRRDAQSLHTAVWRQVLRARAMVEQRVAATEPAGDEDGPRVEVPWLDDFDRALAQAGDEPVKSLAALEDLNRRFPDRMLILFVLSQARRRAGYAEQAIEAARRAFEEMPGAGQRLELGRALAEAGRPVEAWSVLAPLERDDPDDEWFGLAASTSRAAAPGRQQELAEAWTRHSPDRAAPWAALSQARLAAGDVAGARQACRESLVRDLSLLTLMGLGALAAALAAKGEAADRGSVRLLLKELERRVLEEPEAEGLRLAVLLAAGGAPDSRPVDMARLAAQGDAIAVSEAEVVPFLRAQAERGAELDRLYAAGLLCFQTWATMRGVGPGITAEGVRAGDLIVPPPLPPARSSGVLWRTELCLVGGAEVEILAGLGLLDAFAEHVHRIAVFEDTHAWIMNGLIDHTQAARTAELYWTSQVAQAVAFLPRQESDPPSRESALLEGEHQEDVQGWLGKLGYIGGASANDWSPPSRVLLTMGFFAAAHQLDPELLVRAFREQGVVVAFEEGSDRMLFERRAQLERADREAQGAAQTARWLGRLRAVGRLEVLRLPELALPPSDPRQDAAPDEVVLRALAPRLAVTDDPRLVLICGETTTLGINGLGPSPLLEGRVWPREAYQALRERLSRTVDRAVTLSEVMAEIAPDRARDYARAGALDALTAAQLLTLFREFHGFSGVKARELFERLSWILRQERQLTQEWASYWLCSRVWASALWKIWSEEQRSSHEKARFASELLDAVARLETAQGGRFRLIEGLVAGLVTFSLSSPRAFFQERGRSALLSPNTSGAELWQAVGAWASAGDRRVTACQMGIALALTELEASGLGPAADPAHVGAVTAIVSSAPSRPGRGLDELLYAVLAQLPVGLEVMKLLRRSDADTMASVCAAGLARLKAGAPCELDGLCVTVAGGAPMRLPLEVALFELSPGDAGVVASSLQAHDAALAQAVRIWADGRDKDRAEPLRVALLRSPLRRVRADPTIVLGWSRFSQRAPKFPTSIEDLMSILGEPADLAEGLPFAQMVERRLAEGGHWTRPEIWSAVVSQLTRIPGALCVEGPEFGDEKSARDLLAVVRHGHDHPAGEVAAAVRTLARRSVTVPIELDVDLREEIPTLVARLLEPPPPASFAALEPALARVAAEVVAALGLRTPTNVGIWLAWRLYAWLEAQISEAEDPGAAARALAALAPEPAPLERCRGDLYDPRRAAVGRVDVRELMFLQAVLGVIQQHAQAGLNWASLLPQLRRIATRPLTEDERPFHRSWHEPSLGGPAMVAPDLALALLLILEPDSLETFTAAQRLQFLADALTTEAGRQPAALVLATYAERPERWTIAERERIAIALTDSSTSPADLSRYLLAGAWCAGDVSVRERVIHEAEALVGQEGASSLWAYVLTAAGRHGELGAVFAAMMSRCAAVGVDATPYARGLARVLVRGDPEAAAVARQIVLDLAQEPAMIKDQVMAHLIAALREDSPDAR